MLKFILLIIHYFISSSSSSLSSSSSFNSVHIFYYLWYGNISYSKQWKHWNHEVLPHWISSINKQYSSIGIRYNPPNSIHSSYYPLRNTYSSNDKEIILSHFNEIKDYKISIIVVSWWGQKLRSSSTDTQGVNTDELIPIILNTALQVEGVKIAFHLEPYPGRTAQSTVEDIIYIYENYGSIDSIYRINNKIVFYVYDSYHISSDDWSQFFTIEGDKSIRNTKYDSFLIGLWLERSHGYELSRSGFDGIYTYFASDGFSYGSNTNHWNEICNYAHSVNMKCILSVGPGYQDEKIRPWNYMNTKKRQNGNYYRNMWNKAIHALPDMVSITSYNEWGEGTQIEPAKKLSDIINNKEEYIDYEDLNPYGYLEITKQMVNQYLENSIKQSKTSSIKSDL